MNQDKRLKLVWKLKAGDQEDGMEIEHEVCESDFWRLCWLLSGEEDRLQEEESIKITTSWKRTRGMQVLEQWSKEKLMFNPLGRAVGWSWEGETLIYEGGSVSAQLESWGLKKNIQGQASNQERQEKKLKMKEGWKGYWDQVLGLKKRQEVHLHWCWKDITRQEGRWGEEEMPAIECSWRSQSKFQLGGEEWKVWIENFARFRSYSYQKYNIKKGVLSQDREATPDQEKESIHLFMTMEWDKTNENFRSKIEAIMNRLPLECLFMWESRVGQVDWGEQERERQLHKVHRYYTAIEQQDLKNTLWQQETVPLEGQRVKNESELKLGAIKRI